MSKLPILIIIPHGGYKIPSELTSYTAVSALEIFLSADSCANEIFSFENEVNAVINSHIAKLFIDLNCSPKNDAKDNKNGVIKEKTPFEKNVFAENNFPGEIAIRNIIKRYFYPFHDAIDKILKQKKIKLILECHTVAAVGTKADQDTDKPRPLVSLSNKIEQKNEILSTCSERLAQTLLEQFKKYFKNENPVSDQPFIINKQASTGYIINRYSGTIPMLRLNISRSLFLDDKYFNYHYMKVDQLRLKDIKTRIWQAILNTYNKILI